MIGIGIGVAVGAAPAVAAGGINPNLLLWTEEFDNAAWTKEFINLLADDAVAPDAALTADRINNLTGSGAVRQVTTTAAATGAAVTRNITDVLEGWNRYELTGTFDGLAYTFSVYLNPTELGVGYRMRLDRSGGFLRCSLEDLGDVVANWAWGAQLEQAASASAYQHRTT